LQAALIFNQEGTMPRRTFQGTYTVTIDDDDAEVEVTLDRLKDYLKDVVVVDADVDDANDSVGFTSLVLDHDTLTEVSPTEDSGAS
jgi:hypothetical protein